MKKSNDDELIKELVDSGSEIAGSVTGSVIGAVIANVPGAIIGGLAGPVVSKIFRKIGVEIKNRYLGTREEVRIGATYTLAIDKIINRINTGSTLRDDNFFKKPESSRMPAEEILEGILIASQREHEENKIPYLANLYANIAFQTDIDKECANSFIKAAESLSFRQFCLIRIFKDPSAHALDTPFRIQDMVYSDDSDTIHKHIKNLSRYVRFDIEYELLQLKNQFIIDLNDLQLKQFEHVRLTTFGSKLFDLLELDSIPDSVLSGTLFHLKGIDSSGDFPINFEIDTNR